MPAVICHNTAKEYRQGAATVRALRGVDLEVDAGRLTLLAGPSGCGKTTLLSIIVGILSPTSGCVSVLGTDVTRLSPGEKTAFRAELIGFVFQQFNLIPAITAAENAAVPLLIAGWPHRRAIDRAVEELEAVGLGHRTGSLPAQLSGGEQQRVAIARALVHRPRLVVCDEPTSSLDAGTGRSVMQLLRGAALDPGRAVVVVTHDSRVHEFADRVAFMEDGRVVRTEDLTPGAAAEAMRPTASGR